MMFSLTSIAGILVIAVIVSVVLNNSRKKGMDGFSLGLLFLALALAAMILMPELTEAVTKGVGFSRPEFAFLGVIAITAFFFSIKNFFKLKDIESNITKLARSIALEKEEKK